MSGSDVPGRDDRTRRVERPDPDVTRQGDDGATRRIDPPAGSSRMDADPTRQLDPTGYGDDDGYVTVPNRPREGRVVEEEELVEEEPPRNRARDWAIGLGGVVVGVLLAVIVAFLAGDGGTVDDQVAAAEDRIAALEAERDELAAQNDALEARVADAEAAVGEGDAALDAQRSALDDRAAALDERASALDQREAALDDREASLNDREAAIQQREADPPAGDGEENGDEGGRIELPDIDGEDVEGFFDRLFERIRDLF
ncbi:hypothetical protein [Nitriliruptor alkaliphilus]|uniref:hypothetical protein n=1 Tax=Nitriliruptor alkaliphilus TaxID=427918 RepID=UPI000696951B|nr:hypothetical protein [Nitriliruptor alkaliphilus]